MNSISFRRVVEDNLVCLDIAIDGTPLRDLLRMQELPFAKAEGAPRIAGNYACMDLIEMEPLEGHLLGSPSPAYEKDGKTQLLECECRTLGCWPLFAKIELTESEVIWSAFEQPHRVGRWSYAEFGPFVFRRAEYQLAVQALRGDA